MPLLHTAFNGTSQPVQPSRPSHNQRVTVVLPTSLIERLRNAVYWTEHCTLARLVADAIDDAVTELEHANGGVFPTRLSPLKRGRPGRTPSTPVLRSSQPTTTQT